MEKLQSFSEFVNENKEVNEGAFNFLLSSHNKAAMEIAKVIKKQESVLNEKAMGELLELMNKDFKSNGFKGIEIYLK